jgi:hypothetical protein
MDRGQVERAVFGQASPPLRIKRAVDALPENAIDGGINLNRETTLRKKNGLFSDLPHLILTDLLSRACPVRSKTRKCLQNGGGGGS